jgi:hypothetical protein
MRAMRSNQVSPVALQERSVFDAVPPLHGGRSASMGASLGLRSKVFVTRGRLDRQIAAGQPCEGSAALTLRARQLVHSRTQREIARNLRGIIGYVDRRGSRRGISSVIIERAAVRGGRRAIIELAEQLERAATVNPRGIVLARAFLTDGLSPLFNPHADRTVTEAAHEIQDALQVHAEIGFDAFVASLSDSV